MGAARAMVGAGLLVAPRAALSLSRREEPTPASVLLMRTIGIRDLVLGLGTVLAARSGDDRGARRWVLAGLGSDTLDLGATYVSRDGIGPVEAAFAAGAALSFMVLDCVTLRHGTAARAAA